MITPDAPEKLYNVGETVSTDIMEYTLDSAEYAIALSNWQDENYLMPKEYDSVQDAQNPHVAPIGHTYLVLTYTVKNLDRASREFNKKRSIEFNGEFIEYAHGEHGAYLSNQDHLARQNGKQFTNKANEWHTGVSNDLKLFAGEIMSIRSFIDVPADEKELSDGVKVTIQLADSKGEITYFTYLVKC